MQWDTENQHHRRIIKRRLSALLSQNRGLAASLERDYGLKQSTISTWRNEHEQALPDIHAAGLITDRTEQTLEWLYSGRDDSVSLENTELLKVLAWLKDNPKYLRMLALLADADAETDEPERETNAGAVSGATGKRSERWA